MINNIPSFLRILFILFSLVFHLNLLAQDTSFENPDRIGRFSESFLRYELTRCIGDQHSPIPRERLEIMDNRSFSETMHMRNNGAALYFKFKLEKPMKVHVSTSRLHFKMSGTSMHIAVKRKNKYHILYSCVGNGEKTMEEVYQTYRGSQVNVDKTLYLKPEEYYVIISPFSFGLSSFDKGCMCVSFSGSPVEMTDPTLNFLSLPKKPLRPDNISPAQNDNKEKDNKLELAGNSNYIYTVTYTSSDTTRYLENIKYYDNLGRLTQIIDRNITPTYRDLAKVYEYDNHDRVIKEWLPFSIPNNNEGNVVTNAPSAHSFNYYRDSAYIDFKYGILPIERDLMTIMPGKLNKDWDVSSQEELLFNTGKDIEKSCMLLVASNTQELLITRNGNYKNNELYIKKKVDEQGASTLIFTNKIGKDILVRQINDGELHDTYYVYDDYGNLRAVFPPIAVDMIKANASQLDVNSEACKNFAYLYKYDEYNRCTWKKLPGVEPIFYIYDKADQLIFSQDGEQRVKGEWAFSIPDFLGRVVLTGICKNTDISHNSFKNKIVKGTYVKNGYLGYTIDNFTPRAGYQILSANYYDNYDWISMFPDLLYDASKEKDYGVRYGNNNKTYHHMGLITGSVVGVLDSSNTLLYSAKYYDDRGRMIQTISQNHLGGLDKTYSAYNFIGQPKKLYTEQHVNIGGKKSVTTELYTYRYDHATRLKEVRHQLNNNKQIMAILNEYDEVGRLRSVKRNIYEDSNK